MANDMAAANQTMTINQSRKKGDFESIINSEHLVVPQTASINQRKNIVLNVQPKVSLRGSANMSRNNKLKQGRATTQAKGNRSKLAPLEVKFEQL